MPASEFCLHLILSLTFAFYSLASAYYQGRVFMTHPTKAIYNSLLRDFTRLNK